jgi:YVTN family beta-propeller protein
MTGDPSDVLMAALPFYCSECATAHCNHGRPRRRRYDQSYPRNLIGVASVVLLLLSASSLFAVLPTGGFGTWFSHSSGPAPEYATSAHLTQEPSTLSGVTPKSGPPEVTHTIDLVNNTNLPDNALPGNGLGPQSIAYDSGKGEIFVADDYTQNVSVVSDTTNEVVATVPVGVDPDFLTYDSGRGEVFVSFPFSDHLSVISDSTNTVVANIPLSGAPYGSTYDSQKAEIFVSTGLEVISDSNNTVVSQIPPHGCCYALAYDRAKGEIFGTDGIGNVSVFNDTTNSWVTNIAVGAVPEGIAYDQALGELFVADSGSNEASVINDTTNTVVAKIPVGLSPYGVAYDSGKGEVFVSNPNWAATQPGNIGKVSIISAVTNTVVANVSVGDEPEGLAYDSGKGEVFVANHFWTNVSVISDTTNSLVASLEVGSTPLGATFDEGDGDLFVANSYGNSVAAISGATHRLVSSVPVGGDPRNVAYDSGNDEIWVTTDPYYYDFGNGTGNVSVISDSNFTVLATTPVVNGATGIAYDAGKGELFVTDPYCPNSDNGFCDPGNVSIISDRSNEVIATVVVGNEPQAVTYDALKGELFVANSDSNTVSVVSDSTNLVTSTISVGNDPDSLAFDSTNGEILVANYLSNNVSVISDETNTVTATVNVGVGPDSISYDAVTGDALVADLDCAAGLFNRSGCPPSTVTVVSLATNSVEANLPVGSGPAGIVVDPKTGGAYVSNFQQGTLSVISPQVQTYGVAFVENGLPSGMNWTVALNGSTEASTSDMINFVEPNGTYPDLVGSIAGYSVTTPTGNVTVDGTNVTLALHFSPTPPETYWVEFTESGLVSGTPWAVNFNNVTQQGNGAQIDFGGVLNGTYPFNVPFINGYHETPASGLVEIAGGNRSEKVVFSVIPPHIEASATWNEVSATGLCGPAGTYSLTVHFFGNATGGSPPFTYTWNFGDGSPVATLQDPEHTYLGFPYTATLTVTDHLGNQSNASITIPGVVATCATEAPGILAPSLIVLGIGAGIGIVVGLVSYKRRE